MRNISCRAELSTITAGATTTAHPTHRLDISACYRHVGKKLTYEWTIGIYNLYNHYNPYMIYFEDCPDNVSGTRAVQYSMYGIVPSVSYTLKF